MAINIKSSYPYPADALSNFAAHSFIIDGVQCASMEGFLQSLKTNDPVRQRKVCALIGIAAKEHFADSWDNKRWKFTGFLYWQGKRIWRYGKSYRQLLNRAYDALFENSNFRKALADSGSEELTHTIGKRYRCLTVLTEKEFVGQLYRLRSRL